MITEVWQLALVYEVRKSSVVIDENLPIDKEFDEEYGKTYHYVLIEQNGVGIATARLNISNKDYGKIERVAVAKGFKGQGYGRQIIQKAEAELKKLGYHRIVIKSRQSVVEFYQKLGYVADENSKEDGFIATIMVEKEV
ncbi:GNAT family N-acetyltransferase [Lonepinella koalarum]|nr:GNAT family N-acetyltransferase [Lonepinella koalarum]MDH2927381.1 hypothetical protein [Lonepinella koalarum]